MELNFTCSGRNISAKDIDHIKEVIAQNLGKTRRFLSQELCRQWNWRQPNGVLRDMVCRGLMLKLEREGLITLPPRKFVPTNPFLERKPPHSPEPVRLLSQGRAGGKQGPLPEPWHERILENSPPPIDISIAPRNDR